MFASPEEIAATGSPDGERRRSTARRTGEPVRRESRAKGRCEAMFWRRTDRQEMNRVLMAARKFELASRQPGARYGALGSVAIEVLELLVNLVNYNTGRPDPSLDYIVRTLKRCRDAIVNALRALRKHGFIDWLRRFEPTGNEGRGPQLKHASNAYRLLLPAKALQWLGRFIGKAPVPADFAHAQQQHAADMDAHVAAMSNAQKALFLVEDEGLAQALARF